MATSETSAAAPAKGNIVVALGVLTVLAAVGGGLVGKVIVGKVQGAVTPPATDVSAATMPYGSDLEVHELPAIVTNLVDPPETRVRLQVSIVYPKKAVENPDILKAQVNDDLVAFMKTVALKDLQGASGLQNLREDLNDRASVRSQGKVREVIIEALVLQ